MKRGILSILIWLLIACMILPAAVAEDAGANYYYVTNNDGKTVPTNFTNDPNAGSPAEANHQHQWVLRRSTPATCTEPGVNYYGCETPGCNGTKIQEIPATGHQWGSWQTVKAATCKEEGLEKRICAACQKEETRTVAKTSTHTWGAWTVTKEATCAETGARTHTCSVCGKTESEAIPKGEHKWGDWKVTVAPTCTARGKQMRRCTVCGETQSLNMKALGHEAKEWTVTTEPDCKKGGVRTGLCVRCGKELTEKLPKVDHDYPEWVIEIEPTDFSKGTRSAECRFCHKEKKEDFYPDGTLGRKLENNPDAVKNLQTELAARKLYKGKITGEFDKATESAVSAFEKSVGLTGDGIGWPGIQKMLGLKPTTPDGKGGTGWQDEDDAITPDVSKYKLQLTAKRISPKKEYYVIGDEITYEWTLKNASTKKNTAKSIKIYHYTGDKPDKKTDEVIETPADLKPGESVSGIYTYKVTSSDVVHGKFRNGFIARANLGGAVRDSNWALFVHAGSAGGGGNSGWTPPEEEALTIIKTVDNYPDNGFYYVKGETVRWKISIKNKSAGTVDDVIVTDELLGSGWKKTVGTMAPAETKVFYGEYKVQGKDITPGEVENTAVVSYTADGKTKMSKDSEKAQTGMKWDGVHIYKTCTNTPKNGLFFVPGETVHFEIKVFNPTTKMTFKDLRIYDLMYSTTHPYRKLPQLVPYQTVIYTFKTTVTELQAKNHKLTNIVKVTYKDPKKKGRLSESNECTVPCGFEDEKGLLITKKVISTPANGNHYVEGEEIRYEIVVTNNTVKDILTMDLRDSLADMDINGYRTIQAGETLAAGDTYTIHFSYVVTAADVENTKVTNIASVWWSVKAGEFFETYSEPVVVPTTEVMLDKKPKMKPLEGEACVPTLTAMGEDVAQRDLTECEEHTETAKEAGQMIDTGNYTGAAALWDGEIREMYTEWEGSSEGEARRIAENEHAAYDHQAEALDASLALVCSPEEAQAIAAEERMEKCIEMCYELHAAPEDRPDSIQGKHKEAPKGKNDILCSRAVSYAAAGPVHLEDDRCESHATTAQLTQVLLESAEDDEDRTNVWLRTQSNWLMELDAMYDLWYLSAPADQKPVIAADRISFGKLIDARREALAIMYPDDPATAAEVLANMIMHRTEMICHVLHEAGILKD